jgi:homoserine O-acetyltransferase
MVEVQNRLIEHLGIEQLLGVVGGSMGGHQAMSWGVKFPDKVRGVVLLATSPRLSTQSLAFDIVGRNAIRHDQNFNGGEFYDGETKPVTGLAIARMLGHITYLSPEAMTEKFEDTRDQPRNLETRFEKEFSVGSYLAYKGLKFTERFDANSYLTISMAMDQFDFGGNIETLTQTFADSKSRWLAVSYTSDWLFPPEQSTQIVTGLLRSDKPVSYCNVKSNCGHDAFLLADDIGSYGELMRGFFSNLLGDEVLVESAPTEHSPTSIFHHSRRMDYELITELIPTSASVLDLGCGGGGLLQSLKERGNTLLRGVELTEENILACVRSGLDVVHEDLNSGLDFFIDNQFDFVVLSRTLQAVANVELVVDEMLRVGRRCIVSVPNFAYHKLVDMLVKTGRAPEAGLLHYKWYNTPNIRVLTLDDFSEFCNAKNITVHERIALNTETNAKISDDDDPNRNADMAIFVLSR